MATQGLSSKKGGQMIAKIKGLIDRIVDHPVLTKIENQVLDKFEEITKSPEQPKEEPKEPTSSTVESV